MWKHSPIQACCVDTGLQSEVTVILVNQTKSGGIAFNCSVSDQLSGLCPLSYQGAPSLIHFSLKRRAPALVASAYPCSTPQHGHISNNGVSPSSPHGGLGSQYPQTLQMCILLSIEIIHVCWIAMHRRVRFVKVRGVPLLSMTPKLSVRPRS